MKNVSKHTSEGYINQLTEMTCKYGLNRSEIFRLANVIAPNVNGSSKFKPHALIFLGLSCLIFLTFRYIKYVQEKENEKRMEEMIKLARLLEDNGKTKKGRKTKKKKGNKSIKSKSKKTSSKKRKASKKSNKKKSALAKDSFDELFDF